MNRSWIALSLAGLLTQALLAQDTPPADNGASTGDPTITPPSAPEAASPFPTGGPAATPASNFPAPAATGATPAASPPPTTFSLPGGSGFAGQTVTAGEGRFAQPPFRFSVSLSQGYDDNVFSAPTNPVKQADFVGTTFTQEVKSVPIFTFVPGFGNVQTGTTKVTVLVPKAVRIKAPEPQARIGSAVTNARISFQTQAISPRTVYTLDASVGALYYFSRPGGSTDYSGSVGGTFVHRFNPRLSVDAQGSAVYSAQPDFSRINSPTVQSANTAYVSTQLKIDLSYLWTPRISTITSYTFNSTVTESQGGTGSNTSSGDVYENGLGTEFRYLWSPRTTVVAEFRQSLASHPDDPTQDATSTFLLIGGEYSASQRLHTSLRVGQQIRSSTQAGTSSGTPYFESSTSYAFARGSSLSWTNRFGFEESNSATAQQNLTYRTDLSLNYVLGAKLTSSLGIAYNHDTITAVGASSAEAIVQQEFQLNTGLQYIVNRSLSFNLSWTFTSLLSEQPGTDYTRSQIFLGGTYSF